MWALRAWPSRKRPTRRPSPMHAPAFRASRSAAASAQGYLEGSSMAQAFNMLRPSDLIRSYYVNNYLKGKEPMPFDLLAWNSDSTRMLAANQKFYLRHCYLQNDLSNGRVVLGGKTLDLKKVTIPVYELASKEDHIAPARSVFTGAKCFGGPLRYVMAGSGHVAGVVNPPAKPKYQFWRGGSPNDDFASWVAAAKETPGSWWPDRAGLFSSQRILGVSRTRLRSKAARQRAFRMLEASAALIRL